MHVPVETVQGSKLSYLAQDSAKTLGIIASSYSLK